MSRSFWFVLGCLILSWQWPVAAFAASTPLAQGGKFSGTDLVQQRRLAAWQGFVRRFRQASWRDKLGQVNRYINQFEYRDDQVTYGSKETWATPYEFLLHNGGDCEDFAITKYFLLRALGIPEQRLQITYVHLRQLHQYHMVLLYQAEPHGPALVLDNLTNRIQTLSKRTEIEPVYGFNSRYLWVLDRLEHRTQAGTARRLSRWRAVMTRMQHQPIPAGQHVAIKG